MRKGRKSAAQTPAPLKERIYGSSKNPKGSASSKKSASSIVLNTSALNSLKEKREKFNQENPKKKVELSALKAVMRRGMGAYSSSHRPTITGGKPNSRQAWGFARVNKFLEKKAGKKVKAAYIQDDDLMENGGVLSSRVSKFMRWYIEWLKGVSDKMNVFISIPNELQNVKGLDNYVFLDLFEKIDQNIDAKPYLQDIVDKADEFGVTIVLEPISRKNNIDKQYLIDYYSKFGFVLNKNKAGMMLRTPKYSKYEGGGLIAPNGKPSNLTPEQYKLVRTTEFKAWFGDWENDPANASKVVDENGEPKLLFHGTDAKWTIFDFNKIGEGSDLLGKGIYLTENNVVAEFYANQIAKKRFITGYQDGVFGSKIPIYENDAEEKAKKFEVVYSFFANAKRVLYIDKAEIDEQIREILVSAIFNIYKDMNYANRNLDNTLEFIATSSDRIRNYRGQILYLIEQYPDAKNDILKYLKSKYDCFIFTPSSDFEKFDEKYYNYVIFKAENIKLADGTNTTFDANNPDIRYEGGGITETNYFDSTKCVFTPISIKDAREIMDNYLVWRRKKNKPDFIETESFGKLKVDYTSEKKSSYWNSRSKSYYFLTEDNSAVIRVSDHWSRSNYEKSKKLNCGFIRSCWWENYGERFSYNLPSEKYPSELIAGICKLQNFEKRYEKGGKMNDFIALPDTYSTYDNLKPILDKQGYELKKRGGDLPVGKLAKGMTLKDIADMHAVDENDLKGELDLGIETEMEHTDKRNYARAIALDHLYENPKYYTNLKKFEKKTFKRGGEIDPDNPKIKGAVTHASGSVGGLLVGNRHSEGGIKAVNKSTGQPLEMEGGEVVITRDAVSDETKREFEGEMLTNREILSRINESGGGVSFARGGDVPDKCSCSGKKYNYGGSLMSDNEIVENIMTNHRKSIGIMFPHLKPSEAFKKIYEEKYVDGGELTQKGQTVLIIDKMLPTYNTFQKKNPNVIPQASKLAYKNLLKKVYGVDFNELPHMIQTGLLLGSQKLIDNYINE